MSEGQWALVLVLVFVVLPFAGRIIGRVLDAIAFAQGEKEQRQFERAQGLAPGEIPRVLPRRKS